jgi:hypothetical protein
LITYQVEAYEQALPELKEIYPVHWLELALFQDKMPLKPQDNEYIARDRDGRLFLVTCRRNGELIGYYTCLLNNSLHYDIPTAQMDMIYMKIEFRSHGYAIRMIRLVEKELVKRGIQIWYSGYKTHKPLGLDRALTALGFGPADTYLVKWIGQ